MPPKNPIDEAYAAEACLIAIAAVAVASGDQAKEAYKELIKICQELRQTIRFI
jgi:hypothetical protein